MMILKTISIAVAIISLVAFLIASFVNGFLPYAEKLKNIKNNKPIGDRNASSFRLIASVCPASFTHEITIVSTTWSYIAKKGETAISRQYALSNFSAKYDNTVEWKVIKKHNNPLAAITFHNKQVINQPE